MFAAEFEPIVVENRHRVIDATAMGPGAEPVRDGLARALCKVLEISSESARLQTYIPLVRGSAIRLYLPDTEGVTAEVVSASDFAARCRFDQTLSDDLLENLSSQNWETAKAWLASRREFG